MLDNKLRAILPICALLGICSTAHADNFSTVDQLVKKDLVSTGYPANLYKSNTPNANELRSYLKPSCLYYNKTTSSISANGSIFSTYEEWMVFNPNGSVKIMERSHIGGGAGGMSIDDNSRPTAYQGLWNVFEAPSANKMLIVISVQGGLLPVILNGLDGGAISLINTDGKLVRYKRLSNQNC